MNLNDVRKVIYDVTAKYFQNANVIWANQMEPRPGEPFVTLETKNITRTPFSVDSDENFDRYYHCSAILEINLYSPGKGILKDGCTVAYENTVLSDMMDFCNYLSSYAVNDEMALHDIYIDLYQPIQDLTFLEMDTGFRFRVMGEFMVYYTITANGRYGIGGHANHPTASGGGTDDMANTPIEPIDVVKINEKKEDN